MSMQMDRAVIILIIVVVTIFRMCPISIFRASQHGNGSATIITESVE